jgi:hypothetical protein
MTKPFSQSLYDKDDDAKQLIIKWLASRGVKAWVNPNDYGIDLISETGWQYEVEVKHNWKGEKFPYKEVHFPARKLKFANPDSIFVMLNHERTHAMLVNGEQFLTSPKIIKSTIYTKNEEFIEVDVTRCKVLEINYG